MWSWRGAQTAPLLQTGGGIKAEGFESGEKAAEFLSLLERIGRGNSGYEEEPESAGSHGTSWWPSKVAELAFLLTIFPGTWRGTEKQFQPQIYLEMLEEVLNTYVGNSSLGEVSYRATNPITISVTFSLNLFKTMVDR